MTGQLSNGIFARMLFVPIGWLAAGTDDQMVDRISPQDPAQDWQILQRSGAIGGFLGVLGMGGGLLAQRIGRLPSLLIQLTLLITAPVLLRTAR